MPKKKKSKKGSGRRRRRVSGVHPGVMQTVTGIVAAGAGAIAGAFINQSIKTSFTTAPAATGGVVCLAGAAAGLLIMKPTPAITGLAFGLAGAGAMFLTNESFLSLPGVSGAPMPLLSQSNSRGNGFLNQSVGNYAQRGIPQNRVGTFSGNSTRSVGAILSN